RLVVAPVDAVAGRRSRRSQNAVATLPRTQRLRRDPDAPGQLTDTHSNNWSGVDHLRHCKRFHKTSANTATTLYSGDAPSPRSNAPSAPHRPARSGGILSRLPV